MVGGGSVSSTLFVGESLEDVELHGKRAWARRRVTEEWAEDLGFVARKDGWYIRLLARRPPSR